MKTISKTLSIVFLSGLLMPILAQATPLNCDGMGTDKGSRITFEIITDTQVKIDDDLASLDAAFAPRLNINLQRFEYERSQEGISEVLVQQSLLNGTNHGMIKIQNRGEGFFSATYYCHP